MAGSRGARGGTAERIAAVARRIIEAEGPEAVTMRRIARLLRLTPMALYHHYENRAALLQAVADAEFDELAALGDRLTSKRAALPLVQSVDAYLDYASRRPRLFDFVFNRPRPGARRFPRDFRARRSPTLNPVADRIAAAMRSGELRRDDLWEVALQLWAHAHGYVTLYRAGRFQLGERRFRALYHRAVRRLLEGLRTRKAPSSPAARSAIPRSRPRK
jgi:AcrR family transcriptional regulator